MDNEVSIVIVADAILKMPPSELFYDFKKQFETLFNQKNTPFLRLRFMTEEDLIKRIENRAGNTNDDDLKNYIKKYKASYPKNTQKSIFD